MLKSKFTSISAKRHLPGGVQSAPPPYVSANKGSFQPKMIVTFLFRIFRANFDFNIPAKNVSKYPKLACAKIAILHLAASRGLKMCENQIFLTRSKHRIYHKYGIGIYVKFHHRL